MNRTEKNGLKKVQEKTVKKATGEGGLCVCKNNEIGELIDLEFDLFSFSLNAFGLFMLFFYL